MEKQISLLKICSLKIFDIYINRNKCRIAEIGIKIMSVGLCVGGLPGSI